MTRNIRLLHTEMPAYFSEKRRQEAELRAQAQREEAHEATLLMGGLIFCCLITAILIVLAMQRGWW